MSRTIRSRPFMRRVNVPEWAKSADWPSCLCCSQKRQRKTCKPSERLPARDRRKPRVKDFDT